MTQKFGNHVSLIGGASAVLTGWLALVDEVIHDAGFDPGIIIVMPNEVAFCLLLLGLSVLFYRQQKWPSLKRICLPLSLGVLVYGLYSFAFFLQSLDVTSFWPFFNLSKQQPNGDPATSLKLILLASAMLCVSLPSTRAITRSELFSFAAFVISFQSITNYVYRGWSEWPNSYYNDLIYSFLAFVLLSIGIFFLTPERGMSRLMLDRDVARVVFRVLTLPGSILLVALGWIATESVQLNLLPAATSFSLLATLGVLLLLLLSMRTATLMDRMDLEKRKSADAIRDLYETARQAQMEAEEALRTKDQLLAVVSHELRTPLTPILLSTATLTKRPDLPETVSRSLEMIQRNIRLEARLIDELLDYTALVHRKVQFEMAPLELHALLKQAIDLCHTSRRIIGPPIETEFRATQTWVRGDAARLQQVFWNLLKNAEKFTPADGTICLRTYNEKHQVVIEVQDNGCGIPGELLPRVFEAFQQGERPEPAREGLGLGLSIARRIIVEHGGTVTALSDGEGKGSIFRVTIGFIAAGEAPIP